MRHFTSLLAATFALLALTIIATGTIVSVQQMRIENLARSNRALALQGIQAHKALCAFHDDLQRRVESSGAFLKAHPEGVPGISASDIRTALTNQRATLKSLDDLTCPMGGKK